MMKENACIAGFVSVYKLNGCLYKDYFADYMVAVEEMTANVY